MAAAPPENSGFSFLFSWGTLEWMLTGLAGAASAIAAWVWGLGIKIDRLIREHEELKRSVEGWGLKVVKQEADMNLLRDAVSEKYLENAIAREKLRTELIEKISALPTQAFIERIINSQTDRIDQLMQEARSARGGR
jgi:hypothetical protein